MTEDDCCAGPVKMLPSCAERCLVEQLSDLQAERDQLHQQRQRALLQNVLVLLAGLFVLMAPAALYALRVYALWKNLPDIPEDKILLYACVIGILGMLGYLFPSVFKLVDQVWAKRKNGNSRGN